MTPRAESPRRRGLGMSIGRLEAFSDGVLAIVVTLLILDIKVPAGEHGKLGHALGQQWPQYVAYLASFSVVGIIWLNHHATVNLLARATHTFQVLNLFLLLTVSIVPWPTALLAEYTRDGTAGDQPIAVLIYGLTFTAMTVAFNALWRYVLRHPECQKQNIPPELLAVRNKRFNLGLPAYPIATALGLLSVPLFLALMLALALLYLLPTPDVDMAPEPVTAEGTSDE
jgi:uncharacterized membrane protein